MSLSVYLPLKREGMIDSVDRTTVDVARRYSTVSFMFYLWFIVYLSE